MIKTLSMRKVGTDGFTIVETLIAITVLMIAVAGPLVVASRSLKSSLVSRNQLIASYLAQESMEMVKNRRDNNIAEHGGDAETYWLYGFNYVNSTTGSCISSNPCDINGMDEQNFSGQFDYIPSIAQCSTAGCTLYYHQFAGYSHSNTSGSSDSGFKRRFYFEDRTANNGMSEKIVHVFVNWSEGTVPYEIHLTSEIVATLR